MILGAVIVISATSAVAWHLSVKSYAWAVMGSSFTAVAVTCFAYVMIRGIVPGAFILVNSLVLGVVFAVGVGILFKRRRNAEPGAGDG